VGKLKEKLERLLSAFLLACLIAAIAGTIYIAVTPAPGERSTEFYILGSSGRLMSTRRT